jgi:hypothetical protein
MLSNAKHLGREWNQRLLARLARIPSANCSSKLIRPELELESDLLREQRAAAGCHFAKKVVAEWAGAP